MSATFAEFPFDEVRDPQGDYFNSVENAMAVTGCQPNQIWSVTISDSETPTSEMYIHSALPIIDALGIALGML